MKSINKIYKFKIIGKPIAKARPRAFRKGKFIGIYTPKNTAKWEQFVRLQAIQYKPPKLIENPISMYLIFHLSRPKGLSKKIKYHIKRPDVDNLAKSIKDSLEGIFYKNDSQIYELYILKKYNTEWVGIEVMLGEVK